MTYSGDEDDEAKDTAYLISKTYAVKVQSLSLGQKEFGRPEPKPKQGHVFRPSQVTITSQTYDPRKRRIYYGLASGDICFFGLDSSGAGSSRYVGSHKGTVTTICTPRESDGVLGPPGLLLSGSADSTIKIWDYQGRVVLEPTVCVQTLYGHGGTITAVHVHSEYIISSSTDKTVRVWKVVEGRGHLVYPWFDLQVGRPHACWGGGGQGGSQMCVQGKQKLRRGTLAGEGDTWGTHAGEGERSGVGARIEGRRVETFNKHSCCWCGRGEG